MTPFLILHKVRGAPAFDIANKMFVEGYPEPWWIVSTSGHRAYPYRKWAIEDLSDASDMDMPRPHYIYEGIDEADPFWFSLRDHYHVEATRTKLASAASDILSLIGLTPKASPTVKRRVIP